MATMVLDAHALMVLFNDEPGADEVERILLKAERRKPQVADERRELGRDLLFDLARRITRDG
jgi:PIN domain nuclease of toxin-antitoxin system